MSKAYFLSMLIAICLGNSAICEICSRESEDFSKPCFDLGEYTFNLTKKVEERQNVELECYVKNKAAYSVLWMFNNELISLDGKIIKPNPNLKLDTNLVTKFNLRLLHVNPLDKGSYKCQISTLVAQDLVYDLDILTAPTISRSPSSDIITLNQGETLRVQCLTAGNPEPKLTWSKRGSKAEHTTIDETKSELILEDVDQTHADTYSCTANNDIGNPVTSEFTVKVKFAPVVIFTEDKNVKDGLMYSHVGNKEHIKCLIDAYPMPEISLLHNGVPVPSDSYLFKELQASGKQFIMTYTFIASQERFGEYKCVAENELGTESAILNITPKAGDVTIKVDRFPVYSDAVLFEWSALSGSEIKELNVQYFNEENLNGTNKVTKTHKVMQDGTEMPPLYFKENIEFKDFYELTQLSPNTTYTIRLRVRNELDQWSDWSNSVTVKTHKHYAEKKHKPHSYHHKYHNRKQHHLFDGNSNMQYNSYLTGHASLVSASINLLVVNLMFIKALFN